MLNSSHIVVTIADGGVEDGSATYGTPVNISCAIRDWALNLGSTRISNTTRCATIETTAFLRERATIDVAVDIPDDGLAYFGFTVKRYFQVIVKEITTATARTYNCVLTANNVTSPFDALQAQRVTLEVQSVA